MAQRETSLDMYAEEKRELVISETCWLFRFAMSCLIRVNTTLEQNYASVRIPSWLINIIHLLITVLYQESRSTADMKFGKTLAIV